MSLGDLFSLPALIMFILGVVFSVSVKGLVSRVRSQVA